MKKCNNAIRCSTRNVFLQVRVNFEQQSTQKHRPKPHPSGQHIPVPKHWSGLVCPFSPMWQSGAAIAPMAQNRELDGVTFGHLKMQMFDEDIQYSAYRKSISNFYTLSFKQNHVNAQHQLHNDRRYINFIERYQLELIKGFIDPTSVIPMFFAPRLSIILKIWEALSAKAYSETVWFSKPHSSMSFESS